MELRHLRYFVAVAERQSFTRAAADLHVAQPAISQQIKALEDELGVVLLLRNKRSVKITAAGNAFLREAKLLLSHADRSAQIACRAARGEIGTLSIGCFSSAVSAFLPKLIQAYRKKYPLVRIHLHEMTPEQQLKALEDEKIDVGFTRPLSIHQTKTLIQERIYRDRFMLVTPTAHPKAKAATAELKDFAEEDFVLFRRSEAPALVDMMTSQCAQSGFSPRIVSEPSMMQTVLMMVGAGVGVSLVPGCVRAFHQSGIVFLPLRPASPAIDLMLVLRKGDQSPTVAAWMELVRGSIQNIQGQMESSSAPEPARKAKK